MKQNNGKPEILAPAGSVEALTAAVRNGADAVYLGQKLFSARQNADNFDQDALVQAVRICHLHNTKVYLALNTIVFEEELPLLLEAVQAACAAKVDAVIVQDFGVLSLLRHWGPIPIHASTQMSVHTVAGAKLLESLGVRRVVLARELNRSEIAEIASATSLETEVFVHGALCMSVSGQCYLSALIGGRSGNKGSCAGTCRLPFSASGKNGQYDLSLKDSCLAEVFDELEALGIDSLKIEGRMKRPEYVAACVQAYAGLKRGIEPNLDLLQSVFSRSGFTDGYFSAHPDPSLFGVREKEDVVSATPKLLKSLQASYQKETAIYQISMHLVLRRNQPAMLTVSCEEHQITVQGIEPQTATTRPLTEDTAKQSFAKLGGTVFSLSAFSAEIEPDLMLPKSQLNELRRQAVAELEQRLLKRPELPCQSEFPPLPAKRNPNRQTFHARFRQMVQIPWDKLDVLEAFSLPAEEILAHSEQLLPYRDKLLIEPDRVLFGREAESTKQLQQLRNLGFSTLIVSNPAHLYTARQLGFSCHGSCFLNSTNSYSIAQYEQLGCEALQLSFELTAKQSNRLKSNIPLGIVAYGYLPAMITRSCPLQRTRNCQHCNRQGQLTDRTKQQFSVLCHHKRYTEILNSHVLNLSDQLHRFSSIDFAVLYFTTETAGECAQVIEDFQTKQSPLGNFTRGLYFRGVQTGKKE